MATAARSRSRPAAGSTLPQRAAPPSPRERRPGGPRRPAVTERPAPRPPRRRRAPGALLRGRLAAVRPAALLDRLLRGRAWVALIAVLLAGIVFLNVTLLEINGSIARMDADAAERERENAVLRLRIARLGSSERIQAAAARLGFAPVEPGRIGYLTPTRRDAARAARALERWGPPTPPGGEVASAPAASAAAAGPDIAAGASPPAGAGGGQTEPSPAGASPASQAGALGAAGPTGGATAPGTQTAPGQGAGAGTP
jgi:hypothetical protein